MSLCMSLALNVLLNCNLTKYILHSVHLHQNLFIIVSVVRPKIASNYLLAENKMNTSPKIKINNINTMLSDIANINNHCNDK